MNEQSVAAFKMRPFAQELSTTFFGLIFTPVFYVTVRGVADRLKRRRAR